MTYGNVVEAVVLKVSHGEDIRRVNYTDASFDSLCSQVASLFGFDASSIVLKYQDADGDKIIMSSDGELKDALNFAKEQVLRVFVDVTPKVLPTNQDVPQAPPASIQGPCGPHHRHHGPGHHGHHGPHHGGPPGHHHGHHGRRHHHGGPPHC